MQVDATCANPIKTTKTKDSKLSHSNSSSTLLRNINMTNTASTALELERELKKLLRDRTDLSPTDPVIEDVRTRVRDTCVGLLLSDLELATGAKDIETLLWKSVHYQIIDVFRSRIKQVSRNASATQEDKERQKQLTAALRLFLVSSSSFYLDFLNKFTSKFGLTHVARLLSPLDVKISNNESADLPTSSATRDTSRALLTVHKTLVFLGDLARYRVIYSPKPHSYASARLFYYLAHKLMPTLGNPHNQLAVLSTYENDELGAFEAYMMALCCRVPFDTAKENLGVLVNKVRKRSLERQRDDNEDTPDAGTDWKSRYLEAVSKFYLRAKDMEVPIPVLMMQLSQSLHKPNSSPSSSQSTITPRQALQLFIIQSGIIHLINSNSCAHLSSELFDLLMETTMTARDLSNMHYLSVIKVVLPLMHKIALNTDTVQRFWNTVSGVLSKLELVKSQCEEIVDVDSDKLLEEDVAVLGYIPLQNDDGDDERYSAAALSADGPTSEKMKQSLRLHAIFKWTKEMVELSNFALKFDPVTRRWFVLGNVSATSSPDRNVTETPSTLPQVQTAQPDESDQTHPVTQDVEDLSMEPPSQPAQPVQPQLIIEQVQEIDSESDDDVVMFGRTSNLVTPIPEAVGTATAISDVTLPAPAQISQISPETSGSQPLHNTPALTEPLTNTESDVSALKVEDGVATLSYLGLEDDDLSATQPKTATTRNEPTQLLNYAKAFGYGYEHFTPPAASISTNRVTTTPAPQTSMMAAYNQPYMYQPQPQAQTQSSTMYAWPATTQPSAFATSAPITTTMNSNFYAQNTVQPITTSMNSTYYAYQYPTQQTQLQQPAQMQQTYLNYAQYGQFTAPNRVASPGVAPPPGFRNPAQVTRPMQGHTYAWNNMNGRQ